MTLTISNDYKLPTRGSIYTKQVDPLIKLSSMTVADESKRLASTQTPYKTMCDIIDAHMEPKQEISSYDMCLADYVFLLQKIRIETYGSDYTMQAICPECGKLIKVNVNLDEMEVTYLDDNWKDMLFLNLPSGHKCKLKFQTPRDLDNIEIKKKEMMEDFPEMDDPTYLLTLMAVIDTFDGQKLDYVLGWERLKNLPAKDGNYILDKAAELSNSFGIQHSVEAKCSDPKCGKEIKIPFRYQSEFYRPHLS